MKIGMLGLGLIGGRRLQIVQKLQHEVVFAVDPDPVRRSQWANHIPKLYSNRQDVDVPADVILIALPHHLAYDAALWALHHGAHVLCEKPLGIYSDQSRHLCQLANQKKRCLGAGFNYRYLPGISRLQTLLQSNILGDILRVRMFIGHGGRPGMETEWKLQKSLSGGGALMDPGIHLIDLVYYLFGESELLNCELRRVYWNSDVEDNALISLKRDNIMISLEVSLTEWKNRFFIEVIGNNAMAILEGRGGNYGDQKLTLVKRWFWQSPTEQPSIESWGLTDTSLDLETHAFLRVVAGEASDNILATGRDGIIAINLIEKLYSMHQKNMPSAIDKDF